MLLFRITEYKILKTTIMTNKLYTFTKPGIVFILLFFCVAIINVTAQTQSNDSLTVEAIIKITDKKMPDRYPLKSEAIVLHKVLDSLGIKTIKDFNHLYNEYFPWALKEDQRICAEILKSNEENGDYISSDDFSATEEDMENIKKGIFFTQAGIIRQMLVGKFGEEKSDIIRRMSDREDYTIDMEDMEDIKDEEYIEN